MLFILILFGIRLSVVTENLKVINFPKLIFILHFKVTPFKILFQIYYMYSSYYTAVYKKTKVYKQYTFNK